MENKKIKKLLDKLSKICYNEYNIRDKEQERMKKINKKKLDKPYQICYNINVNKIKNLTRKGSMYYGKEND